MSTGSSSFRIRPIPREAEAHRLVKAADRFCAYIKCITEEIVPETGSLHRQRFDTRIQSGRFDYPESPTFMEHFCSGLRTDSRSDQ
jgi:hypothetical protein